ncbi:MAG: hypothetical protein ACRDG9_12290 [Actinomycetota bacterium]
MPTLAEPTDTFPSALTEGSLVQRDPCLFLEAEDGSTSLIIWPYGWSISATTEGSTAVVDEDGRVVHRVGEEIELGGGFVSENRDSTGFPEELIGRPIPDRCKADGYWLASP